ncbi:NAD(P)H-dependent oxidoreductase subunit E [Proteiniclasticum sp. BAD-10]|uniref:NAD(P)H-dependent oxidoreductase subunit E n=1 Tax=Proteiniclasticum sediminis TaxID=2804028 RepID=A0A941CNC6_9CLOT|nr:NAD(P)H-dependent oxidoreductase subunit E [Proteiniclasticum sediminis]MBR0574853.1 NAD(P)H-dependent oxidoreductase subunit E [Proteiniclasticum sediminis]
MCNLSQNPVFMELDLFIDEIQAKETDLIAVLHRAQNLFGYISEEVLSHISERLGVPKSKVYGVVSFYSYFTTEPRGKNVINVCMGTACFVRGSEKILREFESQLRIKAGETTIDGIYTIDSLRCVGACGLAPVVMVNDKVYGRVETQDVAKIINECEV